VDRFYIERFLQENSGDIKGKCLDVRTDEYAFRFGGANAAVVDVLDIDTENSRATVYADLQRADCIPDNTYDCFILTQTIHLIPDYMACIREAYRILKLGGVLLATVPALSRLDVTAGSEKDYWRMTAAGAAVAFGAVFGKVNIDVRGHGNIKAGTAFWHGLAQEEMSREDLDHEDPYFHILVTIRAEKASGTKRRLDST